MLLSVIINDLDFIGVIIKPFETDTPLVIDAYAVLTVAVSRIKLIGFQLLRQA
jgi:hypothetical protein